MTSTLSNKRLRRLAYLVVAALTFMILAAGLSNVQPRAGEIVFAPRQERLTPELERQETVVVPTEVDRGSPLGFIVLFATIAISVYGIVRSRRFRITFLFLLAFAAFLMGAIMAFQLLYSPETEIEDFGDYFRPFPERPPEDLFNNPPDWIDTVSFAVTIGVILLAGLTIWIILKLRRRRKPPLEIVAREAEATLAEIRAGATVKDAVMRCYVDMSQAITKQRGIARRDGMTPREFETLLVEEGLPPDSVSRLTRLFERVRYGGQKATEQDTQEAVAALEEIVQAVRQHDNGTTVANTAVEAYV